MITRSSSPATFKCAVYIYKLCKSSYRVALHPVYSFVDPYYFNFPCSGALRNAASCVMVISVVQDIVALLRGL